MDTRIRLDNELVARDLCESRTEAKEIIERGYVSVEGAVCLKPAQKVSKQTNIDVFKKKPFVSRGGEKLQGALLDIFCTEEKACDAIHGANVLDVGSSTGGFTDCMFAYGAEHVDCVDVGTNQLHKSLRNNKNITVFENQDIRTFQKDKHYDFIVADLSFIPLENIAKDLLSFGKRGTQFFILIKPQFEVGRGKTKKGIVKDEKLVTGVIARVRGIFESLGLRDTSVVQSHIVGGEGNQEYFLFGTL
jgi:23S rRNA (cytidine1920-2'-O)/16S rRNA (cytidine1409-2'-O)-methyltransferase